MIYICALYDNLQNNWKMNQDMIILFITRILRLFSYGCISVIFIQHLLNKGLSEKDISILQTCIIVGDIIISIYLTTQADKIGRKKTLVIGAILKLLTGIMYAFTNNFSILLVSGILGVISVSGGQIGPFMPIEQSSITQIIEKQFKDKNEVSERVAMTFGYYNVAGYLSQAAGAFFSGLYIENSQNSMDSMSNIMILYAILGFMKAICYWFLSGMIEVEQAQAKRIINCAGLEKKSVNTIVTLSILFAFDAWAGGLVMQSFLSYYFDQKFNIKFSQIGILLSICNIVGGLSGIVSGKLVKRFGAMATMIFTHLPSNVFLIFIAFSSSAFMAQFWLILRFCISQMDVPARQTYVTMVVDPAERSAANGITNIARSVGLSLAFPVAAIFLQAKPSSMRFSYPFIIAGASKIIYDITLGFCFLFNKKKISTPPQFVPQQIEDNTNQELQEKK